MDSTSYPEYRDSNVNWLEDIPAHWDVVPIKFSLATPITDGPHETPKLYHEGIPFLSAEAVKEDKLDFSRMRGYISEEEHARFSKKYKPARGDVYMVKSGATTGNVARVETDEEFNIWSPLAAIRPDINHLTTDFIFYFMKSRPFFYSVELSWSYGTQQNIGMGIIANLKMARPPVDEQYKIGSYLNYKTAQIDRLIEKKKALIEKLNEQRIAMITQAVTKGLNPDAPMKDSEVDWLGEVPEHWEVARLRFSIKSNPVKSEIDDIERDDMVSFVPMDAVGEYGGIRLDTNKILDDVYDGYTYFRNNDVVIAKITPCFENGKGSLANNLTNGIAFGTTELHVMRPLNECSERWLFYLSISHAFREIGASEMYGAGGQKRVPESFIKNFRLGIPSFEEQETIADYLDAELKKMADMLAVNDKTIERLNEYRTALITAAVTGKIDVRNIEVPEEY